MPQTETLSTDQTSIYTFTCNPSDGTAPYSYAWSTSPAMPFVVSGVDGEIITFNANNLPGGFYNVQVRCTVTDDVGDVYVATESYQLTVTPFTVNFSGTLVQGDVPVIPDTLATGSSAVTASGYAEGQAPYTLTAKWAYPGQPHPSINYVITSNTTVEITLLNTPFGSYSGVLEVTGTDNIGQTVTELFDVSVNAIDDVDIDTLLESLGPGLDYRFQEASGNVVNYGGLGSTWDMVPKNVAGLTYQDANGLAGAGPYAMTFDHSGSPDPILRVDDAVADFTELNWPAGTVVVAFKADILPLSVSMVINPRQNTLNRDYFRLLLAGNQGYPGLVWASGTDIQISGLTNLNAGIDTYGIQDGVNVPLTNHDGWHVVCWVQRGDGNGPIMYVDGQPFMSDSVSGSNIDNWFDDRYVDWDWLAIGGQIATDGESALGNGFDGKLSRVALMPIAATNAQVYDIQRTLRGSDFKEGDAYDIYTRYLYAQGSFGWNIAIDGGHAIESDFKDDGTSFGTNLKKPQGTPRIWSTSGTSNPGAGVALVADPSGRAARAWRFTGQWRYSSSTAIAVSETFGTSTGSVLIWFRRPNANAATAFINSLFGYGSNSGTTLEQGFQISFRDSVTLLNDPDEICVGWNQDAVGTANSAFVFASAPNDTDWHQIAITADGVGQWKLYLDGAEVSSPSTKVNGVGSLIDWGTDQVAGSTRPGSGNGDIMRTYADWWGLQTYPNKVLTATEILESYQIMTGAIALQSVGDLLPS